MNSPFDSGDQARTPVFTRNGIEDGETLIVGKLHLRILETPGHTHDARRPRAARPDGTHPHVLPVRQGVHARGHTLRCMGYLRTVALDGGLDAWSKAGRALITDGRSDTPG